MKFDPAVSLCQDGVTRNMYQSRKTTKKSTFELADPLPHICSIEERVSLKQNLSDTNLRAERDQSYYNFVSGIVFQ